jgi:hypothetical protein
MSCVCIFTDFPDHYNLELKKTRKIVRGKVRRVDIEIVQRLPTQEAGSFPSSSPFYNVLQTVIVTENKGEDKDSAKEENLPQVWKKIHLT